MNPSAESNIPVGGLAIPGGVYAMEPVPLADSAETKRCKCGSASHLRISHSDCPMNPSKTGGAPFGLGLAPEVPVGMGL